MIVLFYENKNLYFSAVTRKGYQVISFVLRKYNGILNVMN